MVFFSLIKGAFNEGEKLGGKEELGFGCFCFHTPLKLGRSGQAWEEYACENQNCVLESKKTKTNPPELTNRLVQ